VIEASVVDNYILCRASKSVQWIVTTRNRTAFQGRKKVELTAFAREEGIKYIDRRLQCMDHGFESPQQRENTVRNLITEVGLIPKRLEVAMNYFCEDRRRFPSYIAALEQPGGQPMALPKADCLGLEELLSSEPIIRQVFRYCCTRPRGASDFISESALCVAVPECKDTLEKMLERLERLSLIKTSSRGTKCGITINEEILNSFRALNLQDTQPDNKALHPSSLD